MCNFRRWLDQWRWPRNAVVVSASLRGHTVYFVHVRDVVYLLDYYSDLFSIPVARQWVNTVTGAVVSHHKGLRLSAVLAAAVASGTVVETYEAY